MTSPPGASLLPSRCIVVIFKVDTVQNEVTDAHVESQKAEKQAQKTSPYASGIDLFNAFISVNKGCYWNPHLEESIRGLKCLGHIEPSTLLVGGRAIFQDTVLAAWSRRVLRAPQHCVIDNVGELSSLSMTVIPQAHFTPLPEVLCQIISDLTRSQQGHEAGLSRTRGACLDAVLDGLQEAYSGVQQPSEEIVYETLGSLMKERKIYHTGYGYAIVTPDTFQLNGCLTVQDNHLVIEGGPTGKIHIPIPVATPPASPADTRTISCQTDQRSPDSDREVKERSFSGKNKSLKRGGSFKGSRKDGKDGSFSRSFSFRSSENAEMLKDINLKTSDAHQEKDKGDKTSLLGRLFGRSKANKSMDKSSSSTRPELVRFSGQFPPPEWSWQNQSSMAPHVLPHKSATWHHGVPPPRMDAETQSEFFDDDDCDYNIDSDNECPIHKASTFPAGVLPSVMDQYGRPTDHEYWQKAYGFHSSDRSTSTEQLRGRTPDSDSATPPEHSRAKKCDRKRSDRSRHRSHKASHTQRPKSESIGNTSVQQFDSFEVREGEPDVVNGNTDTGHHGDDAQLHGAAFDDFDGYDERIERPSHVSRIFKKYREMKISGGGASDDFAHSSTTTILAKDNGVNCMGLSSTPNNLACKKDERVEVWRDTVHNDLAAHSKRNNLATHEKLSHPTSENSNSLERDRTLTDRHSSKRPSLPQHNPSVPADNTPESPPSGKGDNTYDSIVIAASDKKLCGVDIMSRRNVGSRLAREGEKRAGSCCTSNPLTSSPALQPRKIPTHQHNGNLASQSRPSSGVHRSTGKNR